MTDAEIAEHLTGKYVRLYPYLRGYLPQETLFTLWHMMKAEGATGKLFWGQPGGTPYGVAGDLVDFVKYFEPDPPVRRHLLIAQSLAHEDQVVGLFWFDLEPEGRASGSVFYRRRFWGEPAKEASALAVGYAFTVLGLTTLWAYTPFKTGARHAERAGFRQVARIPGHALVGGIPRDLLVLRLMREECDEFIR